MSTEAGSVFPSVGNLSLISAHYRPQTRPPTPRLPTQAFFWRADVNGLASPEGPRSKPRVSIRELGRALHCPPPPTARVTAHRNTDSQPLIFLLYVNPKRPRLPGALCENTHEKYLQMVCVFTKQEYVSVTCNQLASKQWASIGLETDTKLLFMHGQHSPVFSLSLALLPFLTTFPCAQDMIRHCFFKSRLSWCA